jgi:hypothetical protein
MYTIVQVVIANRKMGAERDLNWDFLRKSLYLLAKISSFPISRTFTL